MEEARVTARQSALNPLPPIIRPRARRRLRREIGAILPVLLQGAFMAAAAVVLLWGWTRWAAAGGLFQ